MQHKPVRYINEKAVRFSPQNIDGLTLVEKIRFRLYKKFLTLIEAEKNKKMEELEKKDSEILKFETYKEYNKSGVNQEVEEEKMAKEENDDGWDIYLSNLELNDSNKK